MLATGMLNKQLTSFLRLVRTKKIQQWHKHLKHQQTIRQLQQELLTHSLLRNHNLLLSNSHQQKEENNKTTITMELAVTQELAETPEPVQVEMLELVAMLAPVQEVPH